MYDKEQFLQAILDRIKGVPISPEHPFTELIYNPIDILREEINSDIEALQGVLGLDPSSPEEDIDKIAANFDIERQEGSKSHGYVTIMFDSPISGLDLSSAIFKAGDLEFICTLPHKLSTQDFRLDASGLYYVTVPIEASSAGSEYNVEAGEISTASNLSVNYISISNYTPTVGGSDRESNETVIARIKEAITDRALTRKTGIAIKVLNDFPELNWIKIVGSGEQLMTRDRIYVKGHLIRLGASADVYVNPSEPYLETYDTVDVYKELVEISTKPALPPFVINDGSKDIPSVYYDIIIDNPSFDNSVNEHKYLQIKPAYNAFVTEDSSFNFTSFYPPVSGDKISSPQVNAEVITYDVNKVYLDVETQPEITSDDVMLYSEITDISTDIYIQHMSGTTYYRIFDLKVSDFTTIVPSDANLLLYYIRLTDLDGNISSFLIHRAEPTYIEFDGYYTNVPANYQIVQMKPIRQIGRVTGIRWISTDYTYLEATLEVNNNGIWASSEKAILPVIDILSNDSDSYLLIGSYYYKIIGAEPSNGKVFLKLRYPSHITDATAIQQAPIISVRGAGTFGKESRLEDVVASTQSVVLRYNTFSALSTIQDSLDGDDYRLVAHDYLARMPYKARVILNAEYKGDVSEAEVQAGIISYINSLSPSFTDPNPIKLQATDIINEMYKLGVDYVNLSTFSLEVEYVAPEAQTKFARLISYRYQLTGEDPGRTLVFLYSADADDITVKQL